MTRSGLQRWSFSAVLIVLMGASLTVGSAYAVPWRFTLADSVTVDAPRLSLGDLAVGQIPPEVAEIVLRADARPGQIQTIERRGLLRLLLDHGLTRDVKMSGATRCYVRFTGAHLEQNEMTERLRAELVKLLPPVEPGAPETTLDIDLPPTSWQVAGTWSVELLSHNRLQAGRNLIGIAVINGANRFRFSSVVTAHIHGEVARIVSDRARGTQLQPEDFVWEWIDLSTQPSGLAVGRKSIADRSAACPLRTGQLLRQSDMKSTPMILQGDPVELKLIRGKVAVTALAYARQDGLLGQIITVRNDINGKLVTARVTGPGLVEWRR